MSTAHRLLAGLAAGALAMLALFLGGGTAAAADYGYVLGSGKVCVTRAAYDAHPVGTWFNNTAGTRAGEPVG